MHLRLPTRNRFSSLAFVLALIAPASAHGADGTWIHHDPGPRFLPSFAPDPARDRMILFSGSNGNGFGLASMHNDTWQLDLSGDPKWTPLPGAVAPPPRIHGVMVHDPTRDRMVMFGGKTTGAPGTDYNDTWAFNLASNTWSPLATSGTPPAPFATHGIYDPVRDRLITFGGFRAGAGPTNEVWQLSFGGTPTWSPITPAGTPPSPRYNVSVIYDSFGDRLIVFGGFASGQTNEVWALSLSGTPTWSQLTPTGTPPIAREAHMAVYDAVRLRMIVFGGFASAGFFLNDVWAMSLAGSGAWSQLVLDGAPAAPRDFGAFGHDLSGDRLVIYGGNLAIPGTSTSQVLGDLMTIPLASIPTAVQVSAAAPDVQPDRVQLRWQVSSLAESYEVFRNQGDAIWQSLGSVRASGSGVVTFEDSDVRSGESYSYRLRYRDEGALRFGGELSIVVPTGFQFALRAPALVNTGRLTLELTLPTPGDANLEVFDVSGRRLFQQTEARAAGRHAVDLGAHWSPGVYWVRLVRGDAVAQQRVTILR